MKDIFKNINYGEGWEGFRSSKIIDDHIKAMAKQRDEEILRIAKETDYKYLIEQSATTTTYNDNGSWSMNVKTRFIESNTIEGHEGNFYDLDKVREYLKSKE